MEYEKTPQLSAAEAMAKIGGIEQQAQVMGANDYEPTAFNNIRERLQSGDITPTQAVAEAQGILDSKQDYH